MQRRRFSVLGWLAVVGFFVVGIPVVSAQTEDYIAQGVWRAEVVSVIDQGVTEVSGTNTETHTQTIHAKLLDGDREGQVIEVSNDFIMLTEGQRFFVSYLIAPDGNVLYSVRDVDRRASLAWLGVLFIAVVLVFGRMQGLRSLISLAGSFVVILYVLLPLLLRGLDPVLISVLIGALILSVAIFFTHGFTVQSLIAFSGTVLAIGCTGVLASVSIKMLSLSGFFSDETVYLNFATNGQLDFGGLLLGGIIIGVLGVLDDIAITQVAVVSELRRALPNITAKSLYTRALSVGREHVSALVNTIVLAYAGVSLPLLLWFYGSETPFSMIINNEVFATEIARTIVGSIGLILTVPITTWLAAWFSHACVRESSSAHTHSHHHGV